VFKIIALCGAIAGGVTFGLYSQTDLLGKKCCSHSCPLDTPTPSCCDEDQSPCCALKADAGKTSVAKAACCDDPCPDCVAVCCDGCPTCAICCGGLTAKVAVGGPAALVAEKPKK